MAIVGFGVSYMLINNATPTVNTELKAARTLCATARYQSENEVKLCRGMKRSAEATDAAERWIRASSASGGGSVGSLWAH